MNGWLLAAMIAAQSFAMTTTAVGIARGCHEATYMGLRNPWVIDGMKGGATIGLTVALPRIHRGGHPTAAKAIAWAVIASGITSGLIDSRALPHCAKQ